MTGQPTRPRQAARPGPRPGAVRLADPVAEQAAALRRAQLTRERYKRIARNILIAIVILVVLWFIGYGLA